MWLGFRQGLFSIETFATIELKFPPESASAPDKRTILQREGASTVSLNHPLGINLVKQEQDKENNA